MHDNDDYEYKCVRIKKNTENENENNEQDNVKQNNVKQDNTTQNNLKQDNVKQNILKQTLKGKIAENFDTTKECNNLDDVVDNYVEYQQDGQEKKENENSLEENKFRMDIGNPDVVKPFINSGLKYYNDIYTESTGADKSKDSVNNELKYGDFNYIGPINKGMINKEYTFVSPTNWYPIPPHPPVCVTNRSCTTCPVQITDGKDYMQWASWDDFDKARRFTGDMNINVKYIKEVLNNPDGY
jgi:hypothetical protein